MMSAIELYNSVKDMLGDEIRVTGTITKREFEENGWKYTFFFTGGKLSKVEAYNHREFIEVWAERR